MDEDVLSDVVPSNIVSRQVSLGNSQKLTSSPNDPTSSPAKARTARVNRAFASNTQYLRTKRSKLITVGLHLTSIQSVSRSPEYC